ncbi:protein LE25-like [Solanum dulcamara]|uniref:protein LE25-like n=1 Tax=Solanum dulcamara TaxID=45834 RepID=UPI002484F35B|nr:protein LE25-like [Solanum dulcamara]
MQAGKDAAAAAKAGMEKTKANVQEKTEKMTTIDPLKKEMATEKKEDTVAAAEMDKRAAKAQHEPGKHGGATTGTGYGTTGTNTTF